MTDFYFRSFEQRRPPPPLAASTAREWLWQVFATLNLALGARYIAWRWSQSLNPDALWFAVPLVCAETLAYVGLALFTINLWKTSDPPRAPPPEALADCEREPSAGSHRPITIDIFIATYNEEEELVRLSIRDALAWRYPHPIDVKVHVLDDGRRETMRRIAEEEGVNYITRNDNVGFKAGNLRNAMEQTSGDFIVICDADTRIFPTILEHTLGYFRDPDVAFVQTPHWFYDVPEGAPLPDWLGARAGRLGRAVGRLAQRLAGPVRVGEDPFANDPKIFFDIIQRRRNWANAAFCCGASSIHRREAVMYAAVRAYAETIDRSVGRKRREMLRITGERRLDPKVDALMRWDAARELELTPYKFHVSEDIFTSIVLHRDRERRWKSVLHPDVESRMLSPQDLLSWTIQRFKYAGGSLDIMVHDNPIFGRGLSVPQRLMYAATFWSYLGALWNTVFLIAPIVYFLTGVSPVAAYTTVFYAHALPFLIANELAFMIGTWGVSGYKGKVSYLASFPISLQAIWTVLRGRQIKFPVTPKQRQSGNFLHLVWPQLAVLVLTLAGLAYAVVRAALGSPAYTWGGLVANGFWSLNNVAAVSIMVQAAFWRPPAELEEA